MRFINYLFISLFKSVIYCLRCYIVHHDEEVVEE